MSQQKKARLQKALQTLTALQRAVKNALQRKRKLGQFAVVWRDGKAALEDEKAEDKEAFFELLQRRPSIS